MDIVWVECRNKKRVEAANLTFMHDENPVQMLTKNMSNLLIFSVERRLWWTSSYIEKTK